MSLSTLLHNSALTQVVLRWMYKDLAVKDIVISPAAAAEQQVDYSHLPRDFLSLSSPYQAAVAV